MADLEQVADHRVWLGAALIQLGQAGQRVRHLAAHDLLEQVEHAIAIGQAQHVLDLPLADQSAAGQGNRLVEQGQAIAHGALGRPADQGERPWLDRDAFALGDGREIAHQLLALDPAQIEALAAGQHGDRDLADLGRGEDEDGLRRRLLQRLQEAVEGLLGQHMDLVDDIDLVAGRGWRIAHAVDQLADVVDAGMGRSVHLQDVDMPALRDRDARIAAAAGLGRGLALAVLADAVERAGDDPGGRGLADAADPGQQECMRDPASAQRIAQGADQGVLADQLGETLRPVGPGQDPIDTG